MQLNQIISRTYSLNKQRIEQFAIKSMAFVNAGLADAYNAPAVATLYINKLYCIALSYTSFV